MNPPAALDAGDADAKALTHARAVVDALPCPEYTPHKHSSGAPTNLKVSTQRVQTPWLSQGVSLFHTTQTSFCKLLLAIGSGERTCCQRLPVRRSCLKPAGRSMRHGHQRGPCSPAFCRLVASCLLICMAIVAASSPLQRLEALCCTPTQACQL